MNFNVTERIWWLIGGLMLLLTVAATTSALAQDQEAIIFEARELLNRARYEQAAQKYAEAYELEQESRLAADALYWRGFALYRTDETRALRKAVEALELQLERHPQASTHDDTNELLARVYGKLAERGEGRAVRWIRERSGETDQDEDTRAAALQSLMMMDPDRALPIVKKILSDGSLKNAELRRQAMFIVGQMRNEEAEDILIGMLENEKDPELQGEIIMWLSMNGSERALDTIVEVYRTSGNGEIGQAALFALGQHGGERAVDLLKEIALNESADPEMRGQALFGLSQSGADDLGPVIVQVLRSSDDPEVQEMALFSLSHMGGDVPRRSSWRSSAIHRPTTICAPRPCTSRAPAATSTRPSSRRSTTRPRTPTSAPSAAGCCRNWAPMRPWTP